MNLLLGLIPALSGLIKLVLPNLGSIKDLASVVVGDKKQRDASYAEADKAAQDSISRDLSYPLGEHRTGFDAAVDGISRLPRPMITMSIWLMFLWAIIDPKRMEPAFKAMAGIPEPMWTLVLLVVGFWFTSRMIEKVQVTGFKKVAKIASLARDETSEPQRESDPFSGLGLASASQQDELLRLAGYGPGVLTTNGFTGRLPPSRGSGWVNPIARQFSAQT